MFDFNEANILKQNLFAPTDTKEVLLSRLNGLLSNTEDALLKYSTKTLIKKIHALTPEQVSQIYSDIVSKKFAATSSYKLPGDTPKSGIVKPTYVNIKSKL